MKNDAVALSLTRRDESKKNLSSQVKLTDSISNNKESNVRMPTIERKEAEFVFSNSNNTKVPMLRTSLRKRKKTTKSVTLVSVCTDGSSDIGDVSCVDKDVSPVSRTKNSSNLKAPKPEKKNLDSSDSSFNSPEPASDLKFVVSPILALDAAIGGYRA